MSKTSYSEKAHNLIMDLVVKGTYPMGAPIPEQEIADTLGISRSPIREAIKTLEAEGIVKTYPYRGAFVVQFTKEDIEEIYKIRSFCEVESLRLACFRIPNDELDKMEEMLLNVESTEEDGYTPVNNYVHSTIINYGGSVRIKAFWDILQKQMTVVATITKLANNSYKKSQDYHLAIIHAIRERNVEKATQLLLEHLKDGKERTISGLLIK